jgi:hypothetical protein
VKHFQTAQPSGANTVNSAAKMFEDPMARITHFDRPKSIDDISENAQALLKRLGLRGQNTLRLTGTPLELIGRGLAMYDVVERGYELEITESGAGLLRIAGIDLKAQPRLPAPEVNSAAP